MKSIQKRLSMLEEMQKGKRELCIAFFWVRRGHEEQDEVRQKAELKECYNDLPKETYYQLFSLDAPEETYENFVLRIRKKRTLEQWWKEQTIRGVPCNDYIDVSKRLKKL